VIERRTLAFADMELAGMDFRGKAAVFDTPWSEDLTAKFGYEEVVKRGAFAPAIKATPSVPLTREHDPKMLLATTHAKTLMLEEDGDALVVTASLPPTPLGEETRTLIDRGDLRGMSYGVESDRSGSKMFRDAGTPKRRARSARWAIFSTGAPASCSGRTRMCRPPTRSCFRRERRM
jgi:HK97 family phage prohead protease